MRATICHASPPIGTNLGAGDPCGVGIHPGGTAADGEGASALSSDRAEFVALICSDTDLLRQEFEELIAEGWGPPEPGPPCPSRPDPAPTVRPGRSPRRRFTPTPRAAGPDVRAAQRAPPHDPPRTPGPQHARVAVRRVGANDRKEGSSGKGILAAGSGPGRRGPGPRPCPTRA
jgi:hypothetical protein